MEQLDDRGETNVKTIRCLLGKAFEGARIAVGDSSLDGRKFRVQADNRNMFLSVSREYLNDEDESRIRRDFDRYNIAKTLAAHPADYFLLCQKGMQQILASDTAP